MDEAPQAALHLLLAERLEQVFGGAQVPRLRRMPVAFVSCASRNGLERSWETGTWMLRPSGPLRETWCAALRG